MPLQRKRKAAKPRQPKLSAADKKWGKMDSQYRRSLKSLQEAHAYLHKAGNVHKHIVLTAGKKDIRGEG